MKSLFNAVAVAVVVLAGSSAAVRASEVRYDFDRTADTAGWKTWSWRSPVGAEQVGLQEARLREALVAGFGARGYQQVEPNAADFRVEYHGAARPQVRLNDTWSPGFGRDLRVDKQLVGTLVVEAYDATSGRLVWRGTVTDALAKDPDQADKKTAKAVAKLLKKFPAQQS